MTAVHVIIALAEFALLFIAAWAVICVLGWCVAAGRADDASKRYAKERGINPDA